MKNMIRFMGLSLVFAVLSVSLAQAASPIVRLRVVLGDVYCEEGCDVDPKVGEETLEIEMKYVANSDSKKAGYWLGEKEIKRTRADGTVAKYDIFVNAEAKKDRLTRKSELKISVNSGVFVGAADDAPEICTAAAGSASELRRGGKFESDLHLLTGCELSGKHYRVYAFVNGGEIR